MFPYMKKYTLRPLDLIQFSVIFIILDLIIVFGFNDSPTLTAIPFILLALLEAYRPSGYYCIQREKEKENE